jgi:hypothetical protein
MPPTTWSVLHDAIPQFASGIMAEFIEIDDMCCKSATARTPGR